ncbi:unnamed protein product, partial [Urochloa humidicola]
LLPPAPSLSSTSPSAPTLRRRALSLSSTSPLAARPRPDPEPVPPDPATRRRGRVPAAVAGPTSRRRGGAQRDGLGPRRRGSSPDPMASRLDLATSRQSEGAGRRWTGTTAHREGRWGRASSPDPGHGTRSSMERGRGGAHHSRFSDEPSGRMAGWGSMFSGETSGGMAACTPTRGDVGHMTPDPARAGSSSSGGRGCGTGAAQRQCLVWCARAGGPPARCPQAVAGSLQEKQRWKEPRRVSNGHAALTRLRIASHRKPSAEKRMMCRNFFLSTWQQEGFLGGYMSSGLEGYRSSCTSSWRWLVCFNLLVHERGGT